MARKIEERTLAIPGVEAVGLIDNLHLNTLSTQNSEVNTDGVEPLAGCVRDRDEHRVGFEPAERPADLVEGRDDGDPLEPPPPQRGVVVDKRNNTLAGRLAQLA